MASRTALSIACCAMSAAQDLFLKPVEPTSSVSALARKATQDNFQAQCASDDDHGWPRFQNKDELFHSPWNSYFMAVYGELPSAYPVCIYDLWFLNAAAFAAAGINGHAQVPATGVQEGDLFMGSLGQLQIYHDVYEPLLANTWSEFHHSAFPTERRGYWVYRVRGSGIWAYSGNTIVFPTPADVLQVHAEAFRFFADGCSVSIDMGWPNIESDIFGLCAREKGYDSIQFEPQQGETPMGTYGNPGLTEMVLVNFDGHNACGTDDATRTQFRSGWLASRHCECENFEIADACGLSDNCGDQPCDPPLCEAQRRNSSITCDPTACGQTTCKIPASK